MTSTYAGAANSIPKDSGKKDYRLTTVFQKRYQAAKQNRDQYEQRWREQYRAYRAWRQLNPEQKLSWQSTYRRPYIYEVIETLLPKFIDPSPRLDFQPYLPQDVANAQAVARLVNAQLYRDKYVSKQLPFLKPCALFGLGWGKVSWKNDVRMRTRRNTIDDILAGAPVTESVPWVYHNDPTFTVPSVFNMLWDPCAAQGGLDDCEYLIEESYVTMRHLRQHAKRTLPDGRVVGVYENLDSVPRGAKKGDTAQGRNILGNTTPEEQEAWANAEVHLCEMYDPMANRMAAWANGVLIRNQEYPYDHGRFPYVAVTMNPDVYKFAGIGEVEPLIGTQDYLWETDQQRQDNGRLGADAIVTFIEGRIDPNKLLAMPGAKWPVTAHTDVQPFQMQPNVSLSVEEQQILKGDLQSISGITYLTGADAGASGVNQDTATGVLAIQSESNKRVLSRIMQLQAQALEEIGLQFHELNEQFIVDDRWVKVGRHDGQWFAPDQLTGRFDVIARVTSDEIHKQLQQKNLLETMQQVQPFMQQPIMVDGQPMQVNPYFLFTKIAELHDYQLSDMLMPMPPPDPNAGQPHPQLRIVESMKYEAAPPSIQRQMEAAAGYQPASPDEHAAQVVQMHGEAASALPQPPQAASGG